jgi:dihydroneopterin aldolase
MTTVDLQSQMVIPSIRCTARLGWSEDERARPQAVSVRVAMRFPAPPMATITDRLDDTVNYAALAETVQAACAAGDHRLLERLAKTVLDAVRLTVPDGIRLWIEVAKERSPLPALSESARVGIGDAGAI